MRRLWPQDCTHKCVATYSLAHPLSIIAPERRRRRRLPPDVTIPERTVGMLRELSFYLRSRHTEWRPILFSLAVAGGSLGLWTVLLSTLA